MYADDSIFDEKNDWVWKNKLDLIMKSHISIRLPLEWVSLHSNPRIEGEINKAWCLGARDIESNGRTWQQYCQQNSGSKDQSPGKAHCWATYRIR